MGYVSTFGPSGTKPILKVGELVRLSGRNDSFDLSVRFGSGSNGMLVVVTERIRPQSETGMVTEASSAAADEKYLIS